MYGLVCKRFTSYPSKALQISSCLASCSLHVHGTSPDINMYACSPLRQAVAVVTVLCTSAGINQGEQSGLCHSVSDAYKASDWSSL